MMRRFLAILFVLLITVPALGANDPYYCDANPAEKAEAALWLLQFRTIERMTARYPGWNKLSALGKQVMVDITEGRCFTRPDLQTAVNLLYSQKLFLNRQPNVRIMIRPSAEEYPALTRRIYGQ
jgi:hypothetical protein